MGFNLVDDRWVPVTDLAGEFRLVSLRDSLVNGDQYREWSARPHEKVALLRLHHCITHAALGGPKLREDWSEVPSRFKDEVSKYLDTWHGSFELFDMDNPWLQMPGIDGPWTTPVAKLAFHLATGNNTLLFDQLGESRTVPIESTALDLLTSQCFDLAGRSSSVTLNGFSTSLSKIDAPCVGSSVIHSYLRGSTLFETVWFSLPTYEGVTDRNKGLQIGVPIWEDPPRSTKDKGAINSINTYLGRLVPMSRFVLLKEGSQTILLGEGLKYSPMLEATMTQVINRYGGKESLGVLKFRRDRAMWRELVAILSKSRGHTPITLRGLTEQKTCDLVVAAVFREQSKINDVVESVYHVPWGLTTSGVVAYEAEVHHAEEIAQKLGFAIQTYRNLIDGGLEGKLKSDITGAVVSRLKASGMSKYWTYVEIHLSELFNYATQSESDEGLELQSKWRGSLLREAKQVYLEVCPTSSSRHLKAFSKGLSKIHVSRKVEESITND